MKRNGDERYNELEEQVRLVIEKYGNVQLRHDRQSVRATEVLKQSNDKNKLFSDVGSPYLNKSGSQKSTEFVYQSPLNKIDCRIECKSRKNGGLIGEILIEFDRVAEIPEEKYCMVLSDTLIDKYYLKQIRTRISEKKVQHKVWVGSLKQFESYLKKNIKI